MYIREELCAFTFDVPAVDTHAHLRAHDSLPRPMDALALFNASGNMRQLWVSSGAFSRCDYRRLREFQNWEELAESLDSVKATAFYRVFLKGLKQLYGLDFPELDSEAFDLLSERIRHAYNDPDWYRKVIREKARVSITCQDSRSYMDRSLLTPVARFDSYVWFGRPEWRTKIIEQHGIEKTSTLDGLIDCLEQDFQSTVSSGAAAVKNNSTWCRRIEFSDPTGHDAQRALRECLASEHPNVQALKVLGDFVMNRICELCARYDIPLQLHTGPAGGVDHIVDWGNPLYLNELMIRHPRTKFVLFHAGGPFANECRDLAVQIPNCYLDLCGVMAVRGLRAVLDDWIERVPHSKLMWGTDASLVEEMFALVMNFRSVLVELLTERVECGYFSIQTAKEIAKAILGANARRVIKISGAVGS